MTRDRTGTLASGLALAAFGVLLLLTEDGTLDVSGGWLGASLSALAGASLLAASAFAPTGRHPRRDSWTFPTGMVFAALAVLLALRTAGIWWSDALVWPLILASFGAGLLWSLTRPTPSEEQELRPRERAGSGRATLLPVEPEAAETARRFSRAGFGIALVLAAALLFLWANGVLDAAGDTLLAALVVIAAVALISAPIWWSMVRRLTAERAARIRSQERAEVAAHLHDSVLQTLALVQRRSDDPDEVAKLARRQERELRAWLAGDEQPRPSERLADALNDAATQVEETHGAIVEAVVVGDAALDERYEALVAATREALTNAAKFAAGGGPVRLYAEISDDGEGARVWVDDRGPGFDPAKIPNDRRGVRESIIGRMQRHGGTADIRGGPEGGTEVELAIGGERR